MNIEFETGSRNTLFDERNPIGINWTFAATPLNQKEFPGCHHE